MTNDEIFHPFQPDERFHPFQPGELEGAIEISVDDLDRLRARLRKYVDEQAAAYASLFTETEQDWDAIPEWRWKRVDICRAYYVGWKWVHDDEFWTALREQG
jgi:hypothetical protein